METNTEKAKLARSYDSKGERAVRANFNPSNISSVQQFKELGAAVINSIHKFELPENFHDADTLTEFLRLKAKAVGLIEDGIMQAVKMATTGL